ncbi:MULTISPECIES: hypothetical protein [Pseudomonas]|uniref:hypothetical protein n=1 Tax=Pseudomonas TaxID=286 RepID=UPI000CDAE07C|nr:MULTISPECIES: hypothetical protein [Pseudomonas]POR67611.1 hypothetical protein BKM27_23530 [Pseudomonas syringae pv. syringae]POR75062.1 hypothetical protein BKM30_22965 [Pseudomonas syringae pv. syringae]BBN63446.1 hypothetical protein KUIN1_26360 [Pseudomonas sp. KUIN-1]
MQQLKTLKHVHTYDDDESVHKLLMAWIKAIERYTNAFHDNPWWYNERASLSILAGAAWTLKDWFALEEFSTIKRMRTLSPGVDEGHLRNGRCDLFIRNPEESIAIEAKQAVQRIGVRADGVTDMNRALKAAWHDTGDLGHWEANRRFAVTFVVPTIPLSEVQIGTSKRVQICPDKVKASVNRWLTDEPYFLDGSSKPTQFAYIFPKVGNADYVDEHRYFPGIVVIFDERLRANQLRKPAQAADVKVALA